MRKIPTLEEMQAHKKAFEEGHAKAKQKVDKMSDDEVLKFFMDKVAPGAHIRWSPGQERKIDVHDARILVTDYLAMDDQDE